jgi:hypothetical protein
MSDRLTHILQLLINEFTRDGHEVIEFKGCMYARIVTDNEDGSSSFTDIDLTRLADMINEKMK